MKAYNFYKLDSEECENNTKLLHRVMNLEVVDVLAEDNIRMVDAYNVCTVPTTIFVNENDEVVGEIVGEVTKDILHKIMS